MDISYFYLLIKLAYTTIINKFKKWSVDSQIYKQNNYIKVQAYDNGEIYDFYIPYCRHQRRKHNESIHDVALVSQQGSDIKIKLYPGCKVEFSAKELNGTHFKVKSRTGEIEEKEYMH